MTHRIAVLVDSTESLEPLFLKKKARSILFPLILKGSAMEELAKNNFSSGKIIPVTLQQKEGTVFSFEQLPWNSDITAQLKKFGVDCLVAPYPCTQRLERWAQKNMLTILSTPADLQKSLENKHTFDVMLKRRGIRSPKTFTKNVNSRTKMSNGAVVVQRLLKDGSYLTSLMPRKWLEGRHASIDARKTLIREYIDGIPLGVSICLDRDGNFFYSSLRRQCFASHNGVPDFKKFIGIQWVPRSFFSIHALQNITAELKKVTAALRAKRYIGIANIDFVLSKEKAYILECNPRLSSATPHVFSIPQLTSLRDPWIFFLNALLKHKNKKIIRSAIPGSRFIGATLDGEMENKKNGLLPKPGVYALSKDRITFLSSRMNTLLRNNHCFSFIHEAPYPGYRKARTIPYTIISTIPLYDINTGVPNEHGRSISGFFQRT